MERQFAALDSLRTQVCPKDLPELQIVAVLKADARDRLQKMTGTRTTPVLLDAGGPVFEKIYGASKKHSLFLFDAQGCLKEGGMEADLSKRADFTIIHQRLIDALRPQ